MGRIERMLDAASRTRLIESSRPYRLDPPGAKEAVLLLHGFTGQPCELRGIADALAGEGYAVMGPRYPGHGSCRADFMTTRAEDWIRRAIDAWLELRADYGTIHLVGHSMGGLIAASLASRLPCPRLVLLAPAFEPLNALLALTPFIAPFCPVIRRGREPGPGDRDPGRIEQLREYGSDDLVAGGAQLERLVRSSRRALSRVTSRILVMSGSEDDSVSPAVGDYVKTVAANAASVELVRLEGAGHLFPFDGRSAEAAGLVRDWMAGKALRPVGARPDGTRP
jgi:carboxylesterase